MVGNTFHDQRGRRRDTAVAAHERPAVNMRTVIRARSPLRLSFGGGGTDLPIYYSKFSGAVLSTTINRYCHVAVVARPGRQVRLRSAELGSIVRYDLEAGPTFDGVLDLAKAAIRRLAVRVGFDLLVSSDAPAGSGLGGSSALTSAVIGAVAELAGLVFRPEELAELSFAVEREDLEIAGGKQDQYATVFGGLNLIEFKKDRTLVTPIKLDQEIVSELETDLLLCYTGNVRKDLGLVRREVAALSLGDPEAVSALHEIRDLAYLMLEALLLGRTAEFAALLDRGYQAKLRRSDEISNHPIRSLYEAARAAGATGGKLCGAGGGGYLLFHVPPKKRQRVRRALEANGGQVASFSMVNQGLQIWRARTS